MWIRFAADMDWKPTPAVTVAYKAGMVENVTRACACAAVAAGKGVRMKAPRKGEVDGHHDAYSSLALTINNALT